MVLCAPIMKTTRSAKLFAEAQQLIPGGVNSPVRAFGSVGGQPRFIKRAKGARLYDVDGNSYIDYVLSWGPMILGHAAPSVISTIKKAAANGTSTDGLPAAHSSATVLPDLASTTSAAPYCAGISSRKALRRSSAFFCSSMGQGCKQWRW